MIQESDISYPALLALRKLHENNKEAYIVGGAVRDILMHKKPHDFDIATSSTPEETLKIFSEFKTYETGIKYGTITVIIESMPIEITTFRTDGEYLNNRQPEKIKFSKNLKDDLLRRDFTINALCYSPKSGLIDLFGGKKDIEDRIIRTVGDPDKRFNEDALRILRALRFS